MCKTFLLGIFQHLYCKTLQIQYSEQNASNIKYMFSLKEQCYLLYDSYKGHSLTGEARWPSGRVADCGARSGVRSSLRSPCCILEQDTFTSKKCW